MLLLISNLHKNGRDICSFNLRVYSEHSPCTGKLFLVLLYPFTLLYNANSLKIPLNYVVLLALFKVNAFPFKNKDKSHIFHAKATFTLCSAAPQFFFRRQSDSSLIVGRINALALKQNIQRILFLLDALAGVSCARNW